MAAKGLFITFEGPEGAGKTTQLKMLSGYFAGLGRECVVTREPGGTPIAEQLRELVKHHSGDEPVFAETELLLFAASRAQHVRFLIEPAVARGSVVLCDRFADSTTAYQGYARQLDMDFIRRLNQYAVGNCVPDMTILLDLPPEDGFKRTATRMETAGRHDRIEAEALTFHHLVRQGFLAIAKAEPQRVKVVSALAAAEVIHQQITELIRNAFGPL
ncbi:MAG: dTMP kinase [Victivallaceae bacterium]|jgi:dTMP kinase